MEGVSQEAIALAGHLKLNQLIVLWDDNKITIDGAVAGHPHDQLARFEASGWMAARIDGHDSEAIAAALDTAQGQSDRPTLIACKTTIGFGAPNKQGTELTAWRAARRGRDRGTRAALDWPHQPFVIPAPIMARWREIGARGQAPAEPGSSGPGVSNSTRRSPFHDALNRKLPCEYAGRDGPASSPAWC